MDDLASAWPWLVFSLAAGLTAWKLGFFRLDSCEKNRIFPSFIAVCGAFIVLFSAQLLATGFWIFLASKWAEKGVSPPLIRGWGNVFLIIFSTAAMIAYTFALGRKFLAAAWRSPLPSPARELKNFTFGILSVLICYPIALLIGQLLDFVLTRLSGHPLHAEQVPVQTLKMAEISTSLFFFMAFSIICIVPVVEEFLFRGCLQSWFSTFLKKKWACAASSVLFSISHFSYSQGLSNVKFISILFVLSCFLGWVYEKRQSLFAPIGLHAAFNGLGVLVIVFL